MIYTVTISPCLDYKMVVDNFEIGNINRSTKQLLVPGGKGINVSFVLKNLGVESIVLGFKAGFIGNTIENMVNDEGLKTYFVETAGESRINVKILSKEESAINGAGPIPSEENIQELKSILLKANSNDIVVLSGSVPYSIHDGKLFKEIIEDLNSRNVKVILDTSGKTLIEGIKSKPFLIKPNIDELEELFGYKINNEEELIKTLYKLNDKGIKNTIVSIGEKGALFCTENKELIFVEAPKGKAISTVGAGDSLVAGFLSYYVNNKSLKESLEYGVCAGSATVFSHHLATKEEIDKLFLSLKR